MKTDRAAALSSILGKHDGERRGRAAERRADARAFPRSPGVHRRARRKRAPPLERHGRGGSWDELSRPAQKRIERYERECRATARLLAEKLKTDMSSPSSRASAMPSGCSHTPSRLSSSLQSKACSAWMSCVPGSFPTAWRRSRRSASPRGGRSRRRRARLYLVSCLNDSTEWIEALAALASGVGSTHLTVLTILSACRRCAPRACPGSARFAP